MDDKIDNKVAAAIIEDAKTVQDHRFMDLISKIIKINSVRYKDLRSMYMSYFTTVCGAPLIFSIENISYLFMLLTSAAYKTNMTGYGLNTIVQLQSIVSRQSVKASFPVGEIPGRFFVLSGFPGAAGAAHYREAGFSCGQAISVGFSVGSHAVTPSGQARPTDGGQLYCVAPARRRVLR